MHYYTPTPVRKHNNTSSFATQHLFEILLLNHRTSPKQMFAPIYEGKFIGTSDGSILSWCPTMDLLTTTMNRMSLWVFRVNGERVYSVNNRSIITEIVWKPDGKCFALMGIDGVCKIYDSNTGKLVNSIAPAVGRPKLNISQTMQWAAYPQHANGKKPFLFDIDILKKFPLLPTPISYASKVMVDGMNEDDGDFLMIVDSSSHLSLTFHNVFTIDDISLPRGIRYTKLALYSLDKLFFWGVSADNLVLVEMNLNIQGSITMEITRQCSKLLSLIAYLEECIASIRTELAVFLDYMEHHLSNFKDCVYEDVDLTTHFPTAAEAEQRMVGQLYDIVVTNLIPEQQKDYWLNQLGERGYKKLHSLGQSAYLHVRRIAFGQIISGLERAVVILSRIEGISKWLDAEAKEDANAAGRLSVVATRAIAIAGDFIKQTYAFVWEVNGEQNHFNTYMEWLRNMIIERLLKEDDIVADSYPPEKYLALNSAKSTEVLKYIDDYMYCSSILKYTSVDKEYEVIRRPEHTTYLKDCLASFSACLKEELFPELRSQISANIQFSDPVVLPSPSPIPNTKDSSSYGMVLDTAHGDSVGYVVCNSNADQLLILQFQLSNPQSILRINLHTQGEEVLKFELLANLQLVILTRGANTAEDGLVYKISSYSLESLKQFNNGSDVDVSQLTVLKSNVYDGGSQFVPKYLALNGRVGCLLDENKQTYKIFAA